VLRLPFSRALAALAITFVSTGALAQRTSLPPRSAARPASASASLIVDSSLYQSLEWRGIGPFRGGRAVAVTGVTSNPLIYYMGATGGGVWKTEDAGVSWKNISDGFFHVGSIGAIAVADDDANVIYVGTGEHPVRGVASSRGDGVYKSTDAGKTWTYLGLENSRQISRVIVHPKNDDVVYVAAQGSRWAPDEDRGIYRSTDGGKTWKRILFVDARAGPSELSMDPTNPRILYAAFWEHQRVPWQVRSGGPNSGIWKSTDGGDNWTRLTTGLPKNMGKIGVAVSPANADRVYAVIEADEGGLYRSDDAGATWRRYQDKTDIRARSWYYMNITADPKNADVVYVMNAPIWKSTDAGQNFTVLRATHGDNHQLWINPNDPSIMINANDGGASITMNGGKSWSTQENQPTAQFYRVNADDAIDYFLYSGQQDNSSVAIKSRVLGGGGIGWKDWEIHGGCESAHIAFDPRNPRYTYAGCYQGIIEEYDRQTGATRNIQAWPALGLAEPSDQQKYRFNWNAPITASPHDGKTLYHGGNVVLKSNDRGFSWTQISPDLTQNDKSRQGLGGFPITNEGAGGEVYGTIFTISESPVQAGVLWVGTDDGNVQVSRDGGQNWTNVTPKNGPQDAIVNAIDPSPLEAGTAYVAMMRYKWNDDAPYLFKTSDFGATWTPIVNGIPKNETSRVVRADQVARGLLFAGTERGAYVSFDDGANWQSLQRKLPHVPVTDLKVHHDDLLASTEGRAFWILDDITPLRQAAAAQPAVAADGAFLFKPRDTWRIESGGGFFDGANVGRNAPSGAILRYALAQAGDSTREVKLEIADATGAVVRAFTSKPAPPPGAGGFPGGAGNPVLPAKKGMNAILWNLRSMPPTPVPALIMPASVEGYRVAPGEYTARLTVDGKTVTQSFALKGDPRLPTTDADRQKAVAAAKSVWQRISEIHQLALDTRSVNKQVTDAAGRARDAGEAALDKQGKDLAARGDTLAKAMTQDRTRNFQDVINFRNGISAQFAYLQNAIDGSDSAPTKGMTERFTEVEAMWGQLKSRIDQYLADVEKFNAQLKEKGIPGVVVPKRDKVATN
jgi:photosystem II stability/assembly factor-like uncharacterized protein